MDIEIQKSPRQILRKTDWRKGVLWHDLLTVIMYKTSTQIRKISHNAVVLEAPKTTPRCGYSLEELTGLSIVVLTCGLLRWKDTKQDQHREKVHGVKSRGSQVQVSMPMDVLHSSSITLWWHMWNVVCQYRNLRENKWSFL